MLPSHRFAITAIGLCSVLGAAGACSSDSPPVDNQDAESRDVSLDGEGRNDAVTPDAAEVDVSVIDAVATDTIRVDVVSTDARSGDAPVDAPLSDRTSNDASPTDGTSGDSALPDATVDATPADASVDSTPADASVDSTPADAPSIDSTMADAPSGDGANDPSCPPSWGPGGQCSGNLSCVYPEGVCDCALACGPPPLPDAGNRWYCGMRGAGCPIQKPAVGTPCSMDAQICNYGSCCQDLMKCEGGQWKVGGGLCPP